MDAGTADTPVGVGQLVLALAKTFHWAGLYGPDHPVLAKRVEEMHSALLSRITLEPEGQLLLGIARGKVLYRNEFLGEGQELVGRLTESLYLRQVATVGFDGTVSPGGVLSLFRYLHTPLDGDSPVSAEEFIREKGIPGITLSPYNYKELLSRRLADGKDAPDRPEGREEELWRVLLTADLTDKREEGEILQELSESPEILRAIVRRARGAGGEEKAVSAPEGTMSGDVLRKLFGRIGALMRSLPQERKQEVLISLEEGTRSDFAGEDPFDILVAQSLTEDYTDDEFLEILAALLALEGKGGERLRNVFGILAGERDLRGSLLPRVGERVRESRRVKNYYALKAWDTVEKLLLSRSEERYLASDHALFLENLFALRGPYLERLGDKPPPHPGLHDAFQPEEMRKKTTQILLDFLRNDTLKEEFSDILEEIRKAIPNLISRGEIPLLTATLLTLDAVAGTLGGDWETSVRDVSHSADFGQIIELALSGNPGTAEPLRSLFDRFGEPAARSYLDRLLNEPEAAKRRALLKLGAMLGPVALPAILERMSHPKWYFVRNLCILLGEVGDRRAVGALIRAASHADHRVRREAIQSIGKLGASEAVPALGKILLEESLFSSTKEDPLRIDAASALYRIGGTEAMGYIHRAAGSRRQAVRLHCEELLRSLKETR